MKKINKFMAALSIGLIGAGLYTPTVDALTSNATVDFTNPSEAPAIVNPDNPDGEPLENPNTDGEVSGEFGPLTLDYVSNFDFGSQILSSKNESYVATNNRTPFAQVTDVRGTGAGWRLVATLNGFTQEDETSLEGSTISLSNGNVVTTSDTNSVPAPAVTSEITLTTGESSDVTVAELTEGRGTWLTVWDNNQNVVLNVPAASATVGQHTGTITWTLYNTPTETDSEPVNQTTQP
ncbi:WxL domain-containing protein [Aerococcus urinaeequi]|uniref:WxL domain-containing protein n=1 Tax=Aerococcus urinaeequi TaxID=51665 RepID=A0AAC8WZ82_9LACT|nr:WxL domain-containing protein [Aerococcus urinaeequi]AMB97013.1 hypothetical protein AWM74_01630 [Aerococcus urinaeequi]